MSEEGQAAVLADPYVWVQGHARGWQFGEAGIIEAIADRLGIDNGYCVEFGTGQEEHQLTTAGLIGRGWSYTLFDSVRPEWADGYDGFREAVVTPTGPSCLDELLDKTPDVLVIDVDGGDLDIWRNLTMRPGIVCIEYWHKTADRERYRRLVPPEHTLQEFRAVADDLGYTEVYRSKVNVLYVRNDLAGQLQDDKPPETLRILDTTWPLPYPDDSIGRVVAESLCQARHADTQKMVQEWVRVLKPGGRLFVMCPDFDAITKAYQERLPGPYDIWLMGPQDNGEASVYRSLHDERGLWQELHRAGLVDIVRGSQQSRGTERPLLVMAGTKPSEVVRTAAQSKRLHLCMTVPRLMPSDNMFSIFQTFTGLDCKMVKNSGVYWHQGLECCLEDAIMDGAEWLVTVDYDTVFSPDDFYRLASIMEANPEIDAIAPMQMRRESPAMLVNDKNEMTYEDLDADWVQVSTAHFGLTIIKASAVMKMRKPWFHASPGPHGDWRREETQGKWNKWLAEQGIEPNMQECENERKIDADIAFWHEFREAGNVLALAPRVSVGHGEWMVTWPTDTFGAKHQYMVDYCKNGKPREART